MPTPKPDAAALSDDIEQLRRFLSGHASMSPASRIAAFGALLAEREEARRLLREAQTWLPSDNISPGCDEAFELDVKITAFLSGKRSTEEVGAG